MSPTFRHGKNSAVVYDTYDLSSMLNSVSYQQAADLAETTAFGASARTYIPGFPGGTVSLAGMFSGGTNEVDQVMSAALSGTAAKPMTIGVEGGIGSTYNGRRGFLCNVWDTSYNVTSPVNDVVAITSEFSYDSRMDSGWILRGLQQFTSTSAAATANAVDTTSTSSTGYVANLHVVTNTRDAGSVTVSIHDSADNAAFALVTGAMFAAVNFGVQSSQRIESTTQTVRRYVAANISVSAGATGNYYLLVSFAKR